MDTDVDSTDLTPLRSPEERLAEIAEMVAGGMPASVAEQLRAKIHTQSALSNGPATPKTKKPAARNPGAKSKPSAELSVGSENEIANRYLRSREHAVVFDRGKLWQYCPSQGVWIPARKVQSPYGYALTCDGMWSGKNRLKIGHRFAKSVEQIVFHQVEHQRFFDDAPVCCVFRDGTLVLSVDGHLDFAGHSPDHRAIHAIDVDYHGDATEPAMWVGALDIWFNHFGPEKQQYIELLQEFVGACLFGRGVAYQRSLMLRGPGGDGKSQATAVIRELFPYDQRSAVKPSSLREQGNGGDDKRAHLAYARINIASDCDKAEFDLSGFKAATGGDEIHCRELREKGFSAVPVAGWILTLNQAFQIGETGQAIRDRIAIIDFKGGRIRDTERDIKDYGMVIARKERAMIIRWAIEGFERLLKRGRYLVPETSLNAVDEWINANNVIGLWSEESLVAVDQDGPRASWSPKKVLYTHYKNWCEANGHKPCASGKLWTALLEAFGMPTSLLSAQNHDGVRVLPFRGKTN